MVLWIFVSCCEAAFNLAWDVAWFTMSAIEFVLQYSLIITGHVLFEWLPMFVRLLYRALLFTTPIAWQCAEAIFRVLATAWMFIYDLPWRVTFITVISTVWDKITSVASLLHRQGRYTVREMSVINYGAIFKHLSETYALFLITVFVGILTCVLIWHNQQKSSRRERSEENREREIKLRRRSELRRRHSRSRSSSHDLDINFNDDTNLETATSTPPGTPKKDDTIQESTDSLTSDTELLRRQLHQANEELSQERDRFLCVVCQDLKREVILKPCNHYCLCYDCSNSLRECPICKSRIRKTEKIYHA